MKTQKKNAVCTDSGKLKLGTGETLNWDKLDIPFGSEVSITVRCEEVDYFSGLNAVVWATYDIDQAETVQGALEAQGILAEIDHQQLNPNTLHLPKIPDALRIEQCIDFIWRSEEGTQLQPDWRYPAGAVNEGFRRWTGAK